MEFDCNLWYTSIQTLIKYDESLKYPKGELPPLNIEDALQASLGCAEYKKEISYIIANQRYLSEFTPGKFFYLDKSFLTGIEEVIMDNDKEIYEPSFIDYTGTLKCRNKMIYDIFSTPIMLS